jgi:hypothetical protein
MVSTVWGFRASPISWAPTLLKTCKLSGELPGGSGEGYASAWGVRAQRVVEGLKGSAEEHPSNRPAKRWAGPIITPLRVAQLEAHPKVEAPRGAECWSFLSRQ